MERKEIARYQGHTDFKPLHKVSDPTEPPRERLGLPRDQLRQGQPVQSPRNSNHHHPGTRVRTDGAVPLDASLSKATEGGVSFPLSNRLYRLAFAITWALLASWTPPPLRGWRRWLLKRFGATMSATANVYGSARIWSPANLIMDDYATIGPRATIYSMGPIRLGAYAIVSQGAHLCAGTHDIEDIDFQLRTRGIDVGARAWVAADAFVGPGVTIGDGAVLGARGCAMRNLDAWTVYTGNPAQPLRERRIRFDTVIANPDVPLGE